MNRRMVLVDMKDTTVGECRFSVGALGNPLTRMCFFLRVLMVFVRVYGELSNLALPKNFWHLQVCILAVSGYLSLIRQSYVPAVQVSRYTAGLRASGC